MNDQSHPLDRFVGGRAIQLAAFVWGLAEATIFFIVPDVLLSFIGCRSVRAGWKAIRHALLGALLGGLIMYAVGSAAPEPARNLLAHVPAIHASLIDHVDAQLARQPMSAILAGPLLGIPYKIYAVESGARHTGLINFLLVSIPARGFRFILTMLVAGGLARLLAPWTGRRSHIELTILSLFWIGFYTFYFIHFGW